MIFAFGSASAAMDSHVAAAALDTKAAKTTKLTKKVTLTPASSFVFFVIIVTSYGEATFVAFVLFADEVCSIIDAAAALVAGNLRIRA